MARSVGRPELWGLGFTVMQTVLAVIGTNWSTPLAATGVRVLSYTVALTLGGVIGVAVARRRWTRPPVKSPSEKLVVALHRRWFPGADAGLDLDYRVSIFEPRPDDKQPTEWVRLARTGKDHRRHPTIWKVETEPAKRRHLGVVVLTAGTRAGMTINGIPEARRDDPAEVARYRKECAIDEATHEQRTWQWATMRTRPVQGSNGSVRWVLVVERESGLPIEIKGRKAERQEQTGWVPEDVCDAELQLSAEVWAASWESS